MIIKSTYINAGIILSMLLVVYLIMRKFGLIKKRTKEDRQIESEKKKQTVEANELLTKVVKAEKNVSQYTPLNPDMYKTEVDARRLITDEKALTYAKELDKALNSWWPFGDDEDSIYSVLRRLPNRTAVSQVANKYEVVADRGLRESLVSDLDGAELATVYDILKVKQ